MVRKTDSKVSIATQTDPKTLIIGSAGGKLGLQRMATKDIVVPDGRGELDYELVFQIQESFAFTNGEPLSPIIVRYVTGRKGKVRELVCGAHRLGAVRGAGLKFIDCLVVDADDEQATLLWHGEDLFRKQLSVLRKAEVLTDFVRVASAKTRFLGHVGQKKKGRPEGGLSQQARLLEWPVIGETPEARRQTIKRARYIAAITPEAKKIATEGKLDNLQNALLEIAASKGIEAQVAKARELAEIVKAANLQSEIPEAASVRTPDSTKTEEEARANPLLAPSPAGKFTKTSIEQLKEVWKRQGKKLWRHAPADVREAFLSDLKATRYRAPLDELIGNVTDLFQGRRSVETKLARRYLVAKGFTGTDIRKVMEANGYKRKKRGRGPLQKSYYLNPVDTWKDEIKVIPESELAQYVDVPPTFSGPRPGDGDYLEIV